MLKNPIAFVRSMALAEAVSYVLLLGVAMPLKYWAGMPLAVRVVGSVHGFLFVVLLLALARAMFAGRLSGVRATCVLVLSFIPLLPFWFDGRIREWEAEGAGGGDVVKG